jgi:hypothetical protein
MTEEAETLSIQGQNSEGDKELGTVNLMRMMLQGQYTYLTYMILSAQESKQDSNPLKIDSDKSSSTQRYDSLTSLIHQTRPHSAYIPSVGDISQVSYVFL